MSPNPRATDPLTPPEWMVDAAYRLATGRPAYRPHSHLGAALVILASGIVIGVVATLFAVQVHAAPRAGQSPSIPVADTVQLGAPEATGQPADSWPGMAGPAGAPSPLSSVSLVTPPSPRSTHVVPEVAADGKGITGIASWYFDGPGLYAAAGPALRTGHWRGRLVTVCAERCVTVRLSDWCLCPRRLIDLSRDAFRRLAQLSRGLVSVTVTGGPVPTVPATDT